MFLQFLKKHILKLIVAVASAFGSAFMNIQIPLALGNLANLITAHVKLGVDNFLSELKSPLLNLLFLYGTQSLLTFIYISLLFDIGEKMARDIRTKMFANLIHLDIAFFDKHKTGEVINRISTDVQEFKSSFKQCVSQGLKCITQIIGSSISLFQLSSTLTCGMLLVIPSIIYVGYCLGSSLRLLSKAAQVQVEKSTEIADEAFGNIRTVRSFAAEDYELDMYTKQLDIACEHNVKLGSGIALFQSLSNLALNSVVLGVLVGGGTLVVQQDISPGDLTSFLIASQMMQRSLAQLSLLYGTAIRGLTSGTRVFNYLNLTQILPTTGGYTIPHHSFTGKINLDNVTFRYETRPDHLVLKKITLEIKPGTTVALCGHSGGGKSTIAALLQRFYEIDEGTIEIDDENIRDLDPSWLRGHTFGVIAQEPVLFGTTIMENIRYGKPDATDEEVFEAARAANADRFIRSFPDGYHTYVGARGVAVSGGQKQRIAIARAILKNPPILILDEATSALDSESEATVQQALQRAFKGRTVIIIAHRLSTIKNADMIAVVDKGKIVETGTHEQLKRISNGFYAKLIRMQESEYSELDM